MTRLEAEGGTVPYRWKIISGHLPPGLNLHGNTGVIKGKPRRAGTYRLMIQVTDAHGLILQKSLTLSVAKTKSHKKDK
jgi:hypothetical protein